jgi:hypothetical protein
MKHDADLIDLMDHLYRFDELLPEREWLDGIVGTASRLVNYGLGATAFTYDFDASMKVSVQRLPTTKCVHTQSANSPRV